MPLTPFFNFRDDFFSGVRSFFPGSTIHDIAGRCSFGSTSWISGKRRFYEEGWNSVGKFEIGVKMAGKIEKY